MKRKSDKSKFIYFYFGSIAVLVVLSVVGYFWVSEKEKVVVQNAPSVRVVVSDLTYVDLPGMTFSLGNMGTQAHVDISIEIAREDVPVLQGYMPQIIDRLNGFMPTVAIERIDEPGVMLLLHKDMLWQINNIRMPVYVHNLVFRRLVVM